ncbi:MAG: N-acetylmuramoyl-L-alanine amidase [Lentisphaeraceae bacterium]|nr:N-acetylmuramoyl-L-alanine amidase [Lentisphaeraceae bacterium]
MLKKLSSILILLIITGCSSGGNQYRYVNTAHSGNNGIESSNSSPRTTYTPPPRKQQASVQPSYPLYVVQKGDTLSSISRRSGITVYNISRFNQLKSSRLEIGQRIYLPGVYKLGDDKLATSSPVPSYSPAPASSVGIISRSKWAKYRIKGNITPMGTVKKITVHHTDDGKALAKMSDLQFLQAMENHHRNTRKWACIGYHFIIGRDGKIYEGRPIKYQGAHASSNNPNNVGISLIGNFNSSMPSKYQMKSLEGLLYKLRKQFKVSSSSVYGHTHLGQTECPGKYLKRWIEIYRTR